MKKTRKSLIYIVAALVFFSLSVFLFYRADSIRAEQTKLLREAESRATRGVTDVSFGIYPPLEDTTWYWEDYLASSCFILALPILIYGVWLRKSDFVDSIAHVETGFRLKI